MYNLISQCCYYVLLVELECLPNTLNLNFIINCVPETKLCVQ